MIAFALLPLGAYFLLLAILCFRRCPTVLGGPQDSMRLALGLFGLLTLGPGKLLIPLDLMAFWGWGTWLFWFSFYFIVAYFISERQTGRIVVYGESASTLVPSLLERLGGSEGRFEGNVLSLPGWGIQCSATGRSGYTLFRSTGSEQSRESWRRFERELELLCRDSTFSADRRLAFLWATLAVGLFVVGMVALIAEFPAIIDRIFDYWL